MYMYVFVEYSDRVMYHHDTMCRCVCTGRYVDMLACKVKSVTGDCTRDGL